MLTMKSVSASILACAALFGGSIIALHETKLQAPYRHVTVAMGIGLAATVYVLFHGLARKRAFTAFRQAT